MSDKREAINPRELDSLMDKAAVRTAADLEQKYNIGQSFAEVAGIANDARKDAESAMKSVDKVYTNFDQDELFKRLTKGRTTGLAKQGEDLYFRGGYISAKSDFFRNPIHVYETGVLLYPGQEEIAALTAHLSGAKEIPEEYLLNYDFSTNGEVDEADLTVLQQIVDGRYEDGVYEPPDLSTGSVVIDFANPEKFICVSGINIWGNTYERFIGANDTNITSRRTEKRLYELEQRIAALENS